VLGVFGDWGVGKTSLMHLLREEMDRREHATVWFNAWKYHGREDVWKALVRAVYCEVRAQLGFLKFSRKHASSTLKEGGRFLGNKIGELLKVGPIVDEIEGLLKLDEIYENAFSDGLSGQIEQLLGGQKGKRLVVFIDDLDRCSPPAIVEVLEALKLYLDIERCVFVLGADEGVVSKVVEHEYGMHEVGDDAEDAVEADKEQRKAKAKPLVEGRAYLQKIVQVPFYVPPMDDEQLGKFIERLVEVAPGPAGVDAITWCEYLRRVAKATDSNPRQMKRFAVTVDLLDSIAPDKVSFEQAGRSCESEFNRLKLAKLVLLQFVAAAFYDTVKRLPGLLYYRQQQAIDMRDKRDTAPKRVPAGSPEHGPPTSADLLAEILAEEPLWESPEEVTCYVTMSAGSVAGARPGGREEFAQVQEALLSNVKETVVATAEMLREWGAEELERHVEALLERLRKDDSWRMRWAAATALGEIGDEGAVEALLEHLRNDDSWRVRWAAATALGEIGDGRAVEALIGRQSEDDNAHVRWGAAVALGKIGGERAVEALISILTEEEDDTVRGGAAWALGKIGDERAVEALISILTEDEDERVRGRAAWALGEIGGERAVEALIGRLSEDESPDVRRRGAVGLGNIGDERAVEALIGRLSEDENAEVRGRAAWVLGEIGDERAVEALIERLSGDEDTRVRITAAGALGKIGGERAVEALKRAKDAEGDPSVQHAIAKALRLIEEGTGEGRGEGNRPEGGGSEE